MLQRPDPQSFTKFLTSVGLFLCIVALVGQGLVLRETQVLQIKEADLRAYTPLARKELQRRQAVARDVAAAAPWVGSVMLLAGIGMLIYAVPRLRRQESAEDEKLNAELQKLKREVEPQNEQERRTRIEAEVAEATQGELAETKSIDAAEPDRAAASACTSQPDGSAVPGGSPALEQTGKPSDVTTPDQSAESDGRGKLGEAESRQPFQRPLANQSHQRAELMQRVANVEERVLRQISRIAPPLYEFRPQVKVGGNRVLLDGLLVSAIDQLPDIVVEIKFVRSSSSLAPRARRAVQQLRLPLESVRLNSPKLWLIMVTESPLPQASLERMATLAYAEEGVILSVIEESRIDELTLPRDRLL